jgi:hypothetical protein
MVVEELDPLISLVTEKDIPFYISAAALLQEDP